MSRLTLSLLIVLAGLTPAYAFDTPKALMDALYAPYATPVDQFDWDNYDQKPFRSVALNALFAKDAAETQGGDIGRLDFDPYVDGQDYSLTKLKIGVAVVTGDTAKVEVTFTNYDVAEDLMFSLVKEADGWKVDDVASSRSEYPYSLKAIMSGPMPSEDDNE